MPIRPLLAALLLALGTGTPALADDPPAEPAEARPESPLRTYPPERIDVPESVWKLALLPDDHVLLKPAEAGVILEDAGSDPRQQLRYLPERNAKMRMWIHAAPRITRGIADREPNIVGFPAIRLDCTATIVAAFPDSFELRLTVTDAEVLNKNPPPGAAEAIPRMYKGRTVTIIADNRGQIIDLVASAPEVPFTPPLTTLEDIARRLIIPLPEEPIGEGAIWSVPRETSFVPREPGAEHTLHIRDRYQLLESPGDAMLRFTLHTEHDQEPTDDPDPYPTRGWDLRHRAVRIQNTGAGSVPMLPDLPPLFVRNDSEYSIESIGMYDTLRNRNTGEVSGLHTVYEQHMHATMHPSESRKYYEEIREEYRRALMDLIEEQHAKQHGKPESPSPDDDDAPEQE